MSSTSDTIPAPGELGRVRGGACAWGGADAGQCGACCDDDGGGRLGARLWALRPRVRLASALVVAAVRGGDAAVGWLASTIMQFVFEGARGRDPGLDPGRNGLTHPVADEVQTAVRPGVVVVHASATARCMLSGVWGPRCAVADGWW